MKVLRSGKGHTAEVRLQQRPFYLGKSPENIYQAIPFALARKPCCADGSNDFFFPGAAVGDFPRISPCEQDTGKEN